MKEYYKLNKEELYERLKTKDKGLSSNEAKKRLEKNGFNELPKQKKDSIFKIVFSEITEPITLLLIVAVIASFMVGEVTDAVAIIFIILVDLVIGVYEENKANKTAMALSNLVKVYAKVIRDGKELVIPSTELVDGDIVLLESGDKIPADIRIISSSNLMVDESTLTGESAEIEKENKIINKTVSIHDQTNMLFASCNVVKGRCMGIVVATALSTEIGKIADKINKTVEEKSPLTIRVEKFSKQISLLIIIVSIFITFLLIYKQVPYNEVFLSVIALSVSAMPEGLPLALTMALTIASNKMAKKGVIAKKLYSIESLGSCTVIASDKTGTLTVNEQTAKKILLPNMNEYNISGVGYETKGTVTGKNLNKAKEISYLGVINNEAKLINNKYVGDSIDIAFQVLGTKMKVDTLDAKVISIIPYESVNKYSAVFYEKNNKYYCTVKGSVEEVLSFCNEIDGLKEFNKDKIYLQNEDLAGGGYRVIALASGEVEKKDNYSTEDIKNLVFKGLVGFIDPIRKEVIKSISQCREAGIKVLMITGDHPLTAFAIGKELKLVTKYDQVTTGKEVDEYFNKGFEKFDEFVKSHQIFSRVTPLQKLEIVESLKRQGEFVAVTGDGVNDAPALRSANIGVAMGSGTDVAKETANMIVIDDNFTSIVESVREGRIAYSNIRKIIYFLISCGLAEILFFLLALLFDMPSPLVAIQLLWLNVVTDGIQDLSLSFERGEENIMKEKPRSPKESLFDKELFSEILVSGVFMGLLVFGFFYYLMKVVGMPLNVSRGYVMALMVLLQNTHVFNCRSEKNSCFSSSIPVNKIVYLGVIGSILLEIIVMEFDFLAKYLQTVSIPLINLFYIFLISTSIIFLMETYKKIRFRKN